MYAKTLTTFQMKGIITLYQHLIKVSQLYLKLGVEFFKLTQMLSIQMKKFKYKSPVSGMVFES